jgi:hypothetical protein
MAAPKTKTAAPAKGKVKTRKKEKKNIAVGKAFIKSTFNNTIISITDPTGAHSHKVIPVCCQQRILQQLQQPYKLSDLRAKPVIRSKSS